MIEDGKLYTSAEIRALLRISISTLRRLVRRGDLAAHRVGRQYRFLGRDVLKCLQPQELAVRR